MDFNNGLTVPGHRTGHRVRITINIFATPGYPDKKPDIVSGKEICHENMRVSDAIDIEVCSIRPCTRLEWPDIGKAVCANSKLGHESGHNSPIRFGIIR